MNLNEQLMKPEDIDFTNLNFWYYYILTFRGYDDEKELNLDDAITEVLKVEEYVSSFDNWYADFFPKEKADKNGFFEEPKILGGRLNHDMEFTIEFHLSETVFYLNSIYIGNSGGHFEAWFLTLRELLAFDKYQKLFMLLLPMTGIEKQERVYAESLIDQRLKQITMFAEHSAYISRCITNGLIIEEPYYSDPEVGIVNHANHSVRNIIRYPRYKKDIKELNKAIKSFVEAV